ncbi:exodeoxyribonuclease VII small subunit [Helicobacter winghamensis]|uniref:Exodeoxyribonuclease VII small subunit n=1 Tax=Helicobacter winghamensis TaxID=157268 RepID=A0A2N3PI84_9HELI|nr:exodeoxyribonuclease VII small subunit [Helicobacter winghamensis]EEO26054.1 exodeoxyribonuclease 7 small subunit family protein [Helicobacter winghamensis ATCC BAA-430]PKT75799.1 exodeoxyribonuclease VII small subunit [Helicobacter winghamensis]PKT76008.1 exodeoxyribonuclease VII small subunit [Helicobacter winghamensis]PKT76245.1 exodeoxyribonuclease VII small subunit [Helicobacter winghamensis]PKT80391.1 exodeoxyribonuclease VII small subunit [Helicobacter winghamensis]
MEQALNFEEYLECATQALEKLGDENISLNESLELYKKGMENLQKAQKLLETAQVQCETIKMQYTKES